MSQRLARVLPIAVGLAGVLALPVRAQAADAASAFSLDDFLSGNVVAATKTAQTLREAPAIIEVITDRDIRERHYRSVAEILRALPGFRCCTTTPATTSGCAASTAGCGPAAGSSR